MDNISTLMTERRNEKTTNIDNMSTLEVLTIINNEDMGVAKQVKKVLPQIEMVVDTVYEAFKNGGKLFYVGAGTSGRIGILDAVECPPTFSTMPNLVQAVIAGGNEAIEKAIEGAEDDPTLGASDLEKRGVTELDVVIGIAASGRTPYVLGALKYANKVGARTVSLTSNKDAIISEQTDYQIEVLTGPEVLTGSTRMKAATAHKLVLNMITTTSMIKIGKVYENLMVDVKVSNEKLKERAKRIVSTITNVSNEYADEVLSNANYEVKPTIVMIKTNVPFLEAKTYIQQADGCVRYAIELANR